MAKLRLGVLCSGRGSNFAAIAESVAAGKLDAEVAVMIADRPGIAALDYARRAGINAVTVDRNMYADKAAFEDKLKAELTAAKVELVALAGFMRILSPAFVREYGGRIMNIHPALLPSFPGAHAHRDVLAYGVKVSGCTVHFVDEGTDSGPIILQAAVPVEEGDTEETLAARVLTQEHILYPRAIALYAAGKLKINGRRVVISNA